MSTVSTVLSTVSTHFGRLSAPAAQNLSTACLCLQSDGETVDKTVDKITTGKIIEKSELSTVYLKIQSKKEIGENGRDLPEVSQSGLTVDVSHEGPIP